jgi:salicylate hydroxylase
MTLHVAIAGAGLGGLAAALFLRKADIDVTVYERARELHEVGAGIVVPPQYGPSSPCRGLADRVLDRSWRDFRFASRV